MELTVNAAIDILEELEKELGRKPERLEILARAYNIGYAEGQKQNN